jgi:hypothetical protein
MKVIDPNVPGREIFLVDKVSAQPIDPQLAMGLATVSAIEEVRCPDCGVDAGEPCRTPKNRKLKTAQGRNTWRVHVARKKRRWSEAGIAEVIERTKAKEYRRKVRTGEVEAYRTLLEKTKAPIETFMPPGNGGRGMVVVLTTHAGFDILQEAVSRIRELVRTNR